MKLPYLLLLATSLSGCNLLFQHDAYQGNYISDASFDQLEPGMTLKQVEKVIGPSLYKDHVYVDIRREDGKWSGKKYTLIFENNRLADIEINMIEGVK